jgi:hypothetical protein
MDMALSPVTQWSLAIIALVNVLLLIGLVGIVFVAVGEFKKLRAQLQPVIDRVNPLLEEAKPIIGNVNPMINNNVKPILVNVQEVTHKVSGMVSDLGEHVHEIAETSQHTVKDLTHRVEATGHVVTENVSKPVINAASVIAGVSRAFSVLKNYESNHEDSHNGEDGRRSKSGSNGTAVAAGDGI